MLSNNLITSLIKLKSVAFLMGIEL